MAKSAAQTECWLVRQARVADPPSGLWEQRDVLVERGRVLAVEPEITREEATRMSQAEPRVIEAKGLWLWPGLVDAHVHFREPGFTHKETLATGSRAALRGGYTAVACEPNTDPPITAARQVESLAIKAASEARGRVYFKAAMTQQRRGRAVNPDILSLAGEAACLALSDDGDPVARAEVMEDVCRLAGRSFLPLSPHCEDSPGALSDFEAGVDPGFEPDAPYCNEANYIRRDLNLAQKHHCCIHFSHVSLAESLGIIRQYRASGGHNATIEATPHHLLLSADDFPDGSPAVNPPLRSREDQLALQEALCEGLVDAVASDHAPHSAEEKLQGACGLIGLETTLGLILDAFVRTGRLAPLQAAHLMSTRPAQILGLPLGSLAAGEPADAVFIDPEEKWEVLSEEFASLSRNTPWEGRVLQGRPVGTMVRGRIEFAREGLRARMVTG